MVSLTQLFRIWNFLVRLTLRDLALLECFLFNHHWLTWRPVMKSTPLVVENWWNTFDMHYQLRPSTPLLSDFYLTCTWHDAYFGTTSASVFSFWSVAEATLLYSMVRVVSADVNHWLDMASACRWTILVSVCVSWGMVIYFFCLTQ